jgi:hypothetical protein
MPFLPVGMSHKFCQLKYCVVRGNYNINDFKASITCSLTLVHDFIAQHMTGITSVPSLQLLHNFNI